MYTCDKRRSKTCIQTEFPQFVFEEGFSEDDELWKADEKETATDVVRRARLVLDMIFDSDSETCESLLFLFCSVNVPAP
jgi:hypothetical protein